MPVIGNILNRVVDQDLKRYYGHYNILQVLGSDEFKKESLENFEGNDIEKIKNALNNKPSADEIIKLISEYAKIDEKVIREKPKGRRQPDPYRGFVMYACRHYGGISQK